MRRAKIFLLSSAALIVAAALPAAAQEADLPLGEVTPERLLNAADEPQNWLMVYGAYNNYMYSTLTQIDQGNVGELEYKFAVPIGGTEAGPNGDPRQQATPLANNGDLYINNAWNEVLKIDVRSGDRGQIVWRFDPEVDRAHARLIAARGIALLGTNVYINTTDARLIAVDMESGDSVFDVATQNPDAPDNQSHTAAPLAIGNMILVGQSQGHTGNRGWLAAFDATTGDLIWRFNTVPAPGEPGHETWTDDHGAWQTGGAAVWTTPAYDPETETVFFGTGDPAPWGDPEYRPGDNLYSASTVALDANTGELKWYFQETPNESWDYDTVQPRLLLELEIDGQLRQIAANASRNGFFYALDRETGEFIYGQPWTEVTWTAGLDAKTGLPLEYDPAALLQDYGGRSIRANMRETRGLNICPHHSGAPTFFPPTYDPDRQIAYFTGSIGCGDYFNNNPLDRTVDYRGQRLTGWQNERKAEPIGFIYGVDVRTGEKAVEFETQYGVYSGLLGTAGGLIFVGHSDGRFAAYDKDTLEELRAIHVGAPIAAPAITYAIEDQQYVAVLVGGQDRSSNHPALQPYIPSATLFVFGL